MVALAIGALVLVGSAILVAPYVARPALLKDSAAVSLALADAGVVGIAFDVKGVDPLAQPGAVSFPGNGAPPPLCSAKAVLDAPFLPTNCMVFWPRLRDSDCRNDRGCARLRVDPTILREPRVAGPVLSALAKPCATFARSPGVYGPRGLKRRVGFWDEIGTSARRLGCENHSLNGRPSFDASSGVITIQF